MHKKIILLLLMIITCLSFIFCTSNMSLIIEKGSVINANGEQLEFYIGKKSKNKSAKKLLIMIQGSGRESIQQRFGMGAEAAILGFDILYLEKYGHDNRTLFNKTNCRKRRIKDISFVVKHVLKNLYDNNLKEVIIFADSEGGTIAPEISVNIEEVTHMIVMGAGGYSQSKELEVLLKRETQSNKDGMLKKAGIENQQQLREKCNQIKNNPTHNKFWLGQTYKYWAGYLDYQPESHLSKLDIPVLYITGREDKMVPFQSIQYLADRFADRNNFRFEIIPDVNHNFQDKSGNNKMNEIFKKIILPWYTRNSIYSEKQL